MLISAQVLVCIPRFIHIHCLNEKAKFVSIQPAACMQQFPVDRLSLTIFYRASKPPPHSLLFPQSESAACMLNNRPICAVLLLPCSHTAREGADAVSSISELQRAAACASENLHQCDLNRILRRLSADATRSLGAVAVAVCRFHFLLSFLNYAGHEQAPLRTEMSA